MTRISTTADLNGHQERIDLINKLTTAIEDKLVEITSSAGVHKYIFLNGNWQIYLSENN